MGKNRSMERLRIKYIRQSKARPRVLRMNNGYQKLGQSVDRSKIPLQYQGLFEYRSRAKGLLDPYLEAMYPGSTKSEEYRQKYLDSITEETDRMMAVRLIDGRLRKVIKLFDARMNCITFMEYLKVPGLLRFSISYSNDDRAMDCFAGGTIRWIEIIELGVEPIST